MARSSSPPAAPVTGTAQAVDTTLARIQEFARRASFETTRLTPAEVAEVKNAAKVEFFSYNPGALISYWDTSYSDNNVGDHPGHGEILPVDARPEFDHYPTGDLARPRILTYDSTFSLSPSRDVHLRSLGEKYTVEGSAPVRTFDDTKQWWFPNDEHTVEGVHPGHYQPAWNSADVPKTGTVIKVKKVQKDGDMIIKVTSSR